MTAEISTLNLFLNFFKILNFLFRFWCMNNSNQFRNDIQKSKKIMLIIISKTKARNKNPVKVERLISTCSTCQQNTTRRDLLRIIQTWINLIRILSLSSSSLFLQVPVKDFFVYIAESKQEKVFYDNFPTVNFSYL